MNHFGPNINLPFIFYLRHIIVNRTVSRCKVHMYYIDKLCRAIDITRFILVVRSIYQQRLITSSLCNSD